MIFGRGTLPQEVFSFSDATFLQPAFAPIQLISMMLVLNQFLDSFNGTLSSDWISPTSSPTLHTQDSSTVSANRQAVISQIMKASPASQYQHVIQSIITQTQSPAFIKTWQACTQIFSPAQSISNIAAFTGPAGIGKANSVHFAAALAALFRLPILLVRSDDGYSGTMYCDFSDLTNPIIDIQTFPISHNYAQHIHEHLTPILKAQLDKLHKTGKHPFVIIDPAEFQSYHKLEDFRSDVIQEYNRMYANLCPQFQQSVFFGAHSSVVGPQPSDQNKSAPRPDQPHGNYCHFTTLGTYLTHQTLKNTFKLALVHHQKQHSEPSSTQLTDSEKKNQKSKPSHTFTESDLHNFEIKLKMAPFLCANTYRSYFNFFNLDTVSIKRLLSSQYELSPEQVSTHNLTRFNAKQLVLVSDQSNELRRFLNTMIWHTFNEYDRSTMTYLSSYLSSSGYRPRRQDIYIFDGIMLEKEFFYLAGLENNYLQSGEKSLPITGYNFDDDDSSRQSSQKFSYDSYSEPLVEYINDSKQHILIQAASKSIKMEGVVNSKSEPSCLNWSYVADLLWIGARYAEGKFSAGTLVKLAEQHTALDFLYIHPSKNEKNPPSILCIQVSCNENPSYSLESYQCMSHICQLIVNFGFYFQKETMPKAIEADSESFLYFRFVTPRTEFTPFPFNTHIITQHYTDIATFFQSCPQRMVKELQ